MELSNKAPALCFWCFDLLYLNGDKLILMPLDQRKGLLGDVVIQADDEHLQFSGSFDDPIRLLETGQKMGFEGIVSKRRESAYRPGPTRDWLKIKTASRPAANRDRGELFEQEGSRCVSKADEKTFKEGLRSRVDPWFDWA